MDRPAVAPPTKSVERLAILGLILLGWALIVLSRLFGLQVLAHDKFVKLAEQQQTKLEPTEGQRGTIFDRDGHPMAISSPSHFLVVNPGRIPNKEIAAELLGSVLKIDSGELLRDLEGAAASKKHRGYYIVDQHVTDEQAGTLRDMKLEWAEVEEGSVRNYPDGAVGAHVIGNVGGQGHGAAGVELKLDKELAGAPGLVRLERDGKEHPYDSEIAKEATPGKDIGLTIDRQLSHVAQDALEQAVKQNHAEHGSVVAMDPRTGEVLALENYPTYDPNERLHPGEQPTGREDLAVVAPFEPGSVFKVITLSAALETTTLRPNSIINCGNGVMKLFTRVIHDHKPYPALSMEDVLAYSSNIGAIRIGMQVGNKNLYEYIRRFGFGRRTGIELPAEAPGILRSLKRWQPTSIGSVPMGHEIAVTSVQLAQAGSVIANGGFLAHPHVVAWKQTPGSAAEVTKYPAPVEVLKPETVATMRMMMRRVITEPGGTGHHLHVVGYTIAGKTGTAQIYDYTHHVYTHKYNASFMGFAPMENPSVVVVVTVTGTTGQAGYGGWAAGPVFVKVMNEALRRRGVPRDVPEEIEELEAKQRSTEKDRKEADDVSLAELSTPLTVDEMKAASGEGQEDAGGNESGDANLDANAPKAPDFTGKTVKEVMTAAAASNLDVEMMGEGLARSQSPAAGSALIPGERIRVRFSR
ncbi:MAG: transpeptidase family protein [Acidobacteriaceae bacterium]|nr:transpeptidase family protein [Acidobacteriaceae bacterium]